MDTNRHLIRKFYFIFLREVHAIASPTEEVEDARILAAAKAQETSSSAQVTAVARYMTNSM